MKYSLQILFAFLITTALPLSAATLYNLSTTKLAGTEGANTFIALNSQASPAGLTYNAGTPSLTWTQGTGNQYTTLFGYFSATSLININDSITFSYTITPSVGFPSATDANFRLGLFSSGSNTKLTANVATASTTFNTYTGYQAYYRVNGGSNSPTASDALGQKSGTSNNLLVTNNTPLSGTLPAIPNGVITGTFTLTLSSIGQVTLTSIVNGGAAQSVTDSTDAFTSFDTFGIFSYAGGTNSTLTLSNLAVTTVPEPSTYALMGLAAVAGLIIRGKMRRIRS